VLPTAARADSYEPAIWNETIRAYVALLKEEFVDLIDPLEAIILKTHTNQGASLSLPFGTPQPGETLQNWLYRNLREAILTGRLSPGSRLPGTRLLAQQHGIARGTVQAAYDQLFSEGYLVPERGSGTRVSPTLPEYSLQAVPTPAPAPVNLWEAPAIGLWSERLAGHGSAFLLHQQSGLAQPFQPHRCDIAAFPIEIWRSLHMRHLRRARQEILNDIGPTGLDQLREEIARYLHVSRGVAVPSEQIVILNSVQQALDICLRLLVPEGDAVLMEDPAYPVARQLMLASGASVVDVPVDEDGIRIQEGMARARHARLAYVTPSRQEPLSVALSPERRVALLEWAADQDAYIFEDDYDSEYRFVGKPIPALRSHRGSEQHVILAGTFSKLLFPGIRLAFVVLPRHLVDPFVRAFSLTSRSVNGLSQVVLADFIAEGHFERHLRRMRRLYARRAAAFFEAAQRHWADLLDVPLPAAGLDIAVRLIDIDEQEAMARLAAAGISAFPLQRYVGTHRRPPGLVMGFAPFDEAAIDAGARRLRAALIGE
jgi:GntR family transcriptional regulator/MocR family aminotransferase